MNAGGPGGIIRRAESSEQDGRAEKGRSLSEAQATAPVEGHTASAGHRNPVVRYLRTAPASACLALIVLVTGALTGTMFAPVEVGSAADTWSAGVITTFHEARWWTPLTSLFVPNDPVQLALCVVFALVLLALAERLLGTARVIVAFLVTGVVGILLGLLLEFALGWGGAVVAEVEEVDITLDPSIGIVGALIAASAFTSLLWRRRIRLVVFAGVLMFWLYNGDTDNFYRLAAAVLGLGLGVLLRRDGIRPIKHSSHRETRNLVAIVTAIMGLGPLAALIPPGGYGPLSAVGSLFSQAVPGDPDAVLRQCDAHYTAACDNQLSLIASWGPGPLLLSFLPLILLLVAALGLRRGRLTAWILAMATNLAILVVDLIAIDPIGVLSQGTMRSSLAALDETGFLLVAAVLVPVAGILLLLASRSSFLVIAPARAVREFLVTMVIAFAVVAVITFVAGLTTIDDFVPDVSVGGLLLAVLRQLLPVAFSPVLGTIVVPLNDLVLEIFQWAGVVFWAVFCLASLRLYAATATGRSAADEERFRELLRRGGGGTLAFMGTWPGNVYWFSSDGQAAVAYRVINGIAITLSDPVCLPSRGEQTVREFASFCDRRSWVPCFYSVHEQFVPVFQGLGWQHMSVGEETLMHPATLDMVGKPWQKVRQALNRGTKEGIQTLWTTWGELPLAMSQRITAISEEWVSEKELPEMGFTLGAIQELKDPEVALFLAVDREGGIQAITSWLPSYRDGEVVGWTIDFMRRGDNAISGIMEFIIASAALKMKDDGIEVLSLSGAPLATKPLAPGEEPPRPTAMTRLLEFLAKSLEPAYGFSSLFKFKSKFNPTYATMYMAYPDPVALPAIGGAIGRAYLPDVSGKEYLALARTLTGRGGGR